MGEFELEYEFSAVDHPEPPVDHPLFIQELIDAHLIQVQVKSISLCDSEYQQRSWAAFCEGLGQPSQTDWDLWRNGFIVQQEEYDPLMTPGESLEVFSLVWKREISIRAVQPSSP